MMTEIIRANKLLLEPIEGNINIAKIIKNKKNNFKGLRNEINIPNSSGINADKKRPKEFGSLKVELI